MDDIVVGRAHEAGVWRGPERRPWLRRIAHGAGFTNHWDLTQLPTEAEAAADAAALEPPRDVPAAEVDVLRPAASFRLWWLPSAHDR
jgi:hypothetical protein